MKLTKKLILSRNQNNTALLIFSIVFIMLFVVSIVLTSFPSQAQIASILIRSNGVVITVKYKEPVIFVTHSITNSSGASFIFASYRYPLHYPNERNSTFISEAFLPPGKYTYSITVRDDYGNQRTDSKGFEMVGPEGPIDCGNNKLDPGEECDDGNKVNGDGCNSFCQKEFCSNNKVDLLGEECDGADLNGQTCLSIGNFVGGELGCTKTCFFNTSKCIKAPNWCGNKIVEPGEACDGSVPISVKCSNLSSSFTQGFGALRCINCTYITNECIGIQYGYCGDGIVEVGENCDWNSEWPNGIEPGINCSSINPAFTSGILKCNRDCTFNTSLCNYTQPQKICGDGMKNLLNEECDKNDFGSTTCQSLGFDRGTLKCTDDCKLDKSDCVSDKTDPKICGDGIIQTPNDAGFNEQCDKNNTNNMACPPTIYSGGSVKCTGLCTYDYSSCINITQPTCNDGIVNTYEEECDLNDLGGATCAFFGYDHGILKCNRTCKWDKSNCSIIKPYCGDGVINQDSEQCDYSKILGLLDLGGVKCTDRDQYIGGVLNCTGYCSFDDKKCISPVNDCGNGFLEPGEQCDPRHTVTSVPCKNISAAFSSGIASCNNSCVFSTLSCTGSTGGSCGDGRIVEGEQCEPSIFTSKSCQELNRNFTGGWLSCKSNCMYDTSNCTTQRLAACGDNLINQLWESCDGTDLGTASCQSLGMLGTGLRCHSNCSLDKSNCTSLPGATYCGDGIIQAPNSAGFNEECDGSNLGGKTCSSFSSAYSGGVLKCRSDCVLDFTDCTPINTPRCNDGVRNQLTEECDGLDLDGNTCQFLGFDEGILSCNSTCKLDKSKCTYTQKVCGDGIVQKPNDAKMNESCDKNDLNGYVCSMLDDYVGGQLGCINATCSFDYSNCYKSINQCGNGRIDPGENCDPKNFSLIPCINLSNAFTSGTATCNSTSCLWITLGCTGDTGGFCGNGNVEVGESCDYKASDPLGGKTCSDINPRFTGGTLTCTDKCIYNTSKCSTAPPSTCGDGILSLGYEECDGNLFGSVNSCTNFSQFNGGTLLCINCKINTSKCTTPPPPPVGCGDGKLNYSSGEECDDGNNIAWDGCSPYCKIERCGDNIINVVGELCDGTDLQGMTCEALGFPGGTLLCNKNTCTFNTTKCYKKINFCGDGKVQPGEDCDGSVPSSVRCTNISNFFTGGILYCNPETCKYSTSSCTGPIDGWCGDNSVSRGESCDNNVGGRTCSNINPAFIPGGYLGCDNTNCLFNTTLCLIAEENICGDGSILGAEECDGTVFGTIRQCSDLPKYSGGTLLCSNCTLNTSKCIPKEEPPPPPPPPIGCGNRVLETSLGEECDDGNTLSGDGCSSSCKREICNNNRLDAYEVCDGTLLNGISCYDFGFEGGTLLCSNCQFNTSKCNQPPNFCGDGVIQPGESCDPYAALTSILCANLSSSFAGAAITRYASCNQTNCMWKTTSCLGPTDGWCGDGVVEVGENCDPKLYNNGVGNRTCSDVNPAFTGGTLTCTNDCLFNTTRCLLGTGPYCGDGVKNSASEQCDKNDFGSTTCQSLGFASGYLVCDNCKLNTSFCVPGQGTYCGDGVVQKPNSAGMNEQCDGKISMACPSNIYSGGNVSCVACAYDYSDCIGLPKCNDGVKNGNEECDGNDLGTTTCMSLGYETGTLKCTSGCKLDRSGCSNYPKICGDGVVQRPNDAGLLEQCDTPDMNGSTCMSIGYDEGILSCRGDCKLDITSCFYKTNYCGDGRIQPGEACDPYNISRIPCISLSNSFTSGTATCNATSCAWNTKDCLGPKEGYCGNGVVEVGENCDYAAQDPVGGKTCSDINPVFVSGELGCTRTCLFNTSLCRPEAQRICGDGAKNVLGEVCDGNDFGGLTCKSFGFDGGNLTCNSSCQVDKSKCFKTKPEAKVCGDGIVQRPNDAGFNEQCDAINLTGRSCTSFSEYTGGNLACYSDCTFDYSNCTRTTTPRCQDGVRNQLSEECDKTDLIGLTCIFLGYDGGNLSCSSDCKLNKSSCISLSAVCGDGIINRPSEECDKNDLRNTTCEDLGYNTGTLSCKGDCSFDHSKCNYTSFEGYCGDGILNGYEICDGSSWGSILGCESFQAYMGGTLSCRRDICQFDTTGCLPISPQPNASCYDLEKNGDETDFNCGGSCPPCPNGQACLFNKDCLSNYCKDNICVEASCQDGIKNGLESDIDCGGSCSPCQPNMGCNSDRDCSAELYCHPLNRMCAVPSCEDGIKNGLESDIDCGGTCPLPCSSNQGCVSDKDCEQGYTCVAGQCTSNINQDTDGDGMPDWWENRYFLDPNNPLDAQEDLDGDGRTNLQEYLDGTDPTVPDGFASKKKGPLPKVLLIIGLFLMLVSTGFLVYSRKVLIPEQRKAAAAKAARQASSQEQPGIRVRTPGVGATGLSKEELAARLAQRQAARRSMLKGFAEEKTTQPGEVEKEEGIGGSTKPLSKKPPQETKKPRDEFIPLSKLAKLGKSSETEKNKETKRQESDKKQSAIPSGEEKPKGSIFEKLKQLTSSRKNPDESEKKEKN